MFVFRGFFSEYWDFSLKALSYKENLVGRDIFQGLNTRFGYLLGCSGLQGQQRYLFEYWTEKNGS